MAGGLDDNVLRELDSKQLVAHLRAALDAGQSPESISQHLLHAVASESLSAQCFTLWLSACPDTSPIRPGLAQTHSIWIRRAALQAFNRWFQGSRCVTVWEALGGTAGVVALMSQWSIDEVKLFCGMVQRCSGKRRARVERQRLVTELVTALLGGSFFETGSQNSDRRPLTKYYSEMVYACTLDLIDVWLARDGLPYIDRVRVVHAHASDYKQRCLQAIQNGETELEMYSPLFDGSLTDPDQQNLVISTTMDFRHEVLSSMLRQAEQSGYDLTKQGPKDIMAKLLRSVSKGKFPKEWSEEIIRLLEACRLQSNDSGKALVLNYINVEHDIFRLWLKGFTNDLLDGLLLLTAVRPKFTLDFVLYNHVWRVNKGRRGDFVRWLLLRSEPKSIDLDNEEDLMLGSLQYAWAPSIFQLTLPRDAALDFFSKLSKVRPDGSFLRTSSPGGSTELGVALVGLSLEAEARADQVEKEASEHMHDMMKKAETSREQTHRAEYAELAIRFATASRSLDVLSRALLWARRYNRDPLTTMSLYGNDTIANSDIVGLLSGLSGSPNSKSTPAQAAERILKGNDILLLLIETVIMCQREPSFQFYHWHHVHSLFYHVVKTRLDRVEALQKGLELSDDAVYSIVWQSTLEMLISAEELALDKDNGRLQMNNIGGPLFARGLSTIVRDPSQATLQFMEELMRRRDDIWQRYRPTVHPAVTTLKDPWPRGLPAQALNPAFVVESPSGLALPYLEERIKRIIFADPRQALQALPDDDELRAAIGCFVESYEWALSAYVKCGGIPNESRAREAWAHAIGPLSESRMSAIEAKVYWKAVFRSAGLDATPATAGLPKRDGPSRYAVGSSQDVVEWNPDETPNTILVKSKSLEPTCIDYFAACRTFIQAGTINSNFPPRLHASVPEYRLGDFWDFNPYGGRVPPRAREDYIAAALLFIEGTVNARSKILGSPFPSTANVRFPAVFLDQAFLDRKGSTMHDIERMLWQLRAHIPPTLLQRLVEGLMEKFVLESKPSPTLRQWTFAMLKLLAWSDRPELALEFISVIVVGMPQESSWHREVLHHGVMNRLPAPNAQSLMDGLRKIIVTKLETQARTEDKEEQTPEQIKSTGDWRQTLNGSRIKITTTKLLAQILNGAEYVDARFSVDVLADLFKRSKHPDIQVAVVESLMSMLCTSCDSELQDAILEALETHALPVAMNLNEREPVMEEDWLKAELSNKPPNPYEYDRMFAKLPPVRLALFRAANQPPSVRSSALIDQLINRLILPIITSSLQHYTRWTAILLRSHGAEDLAHSLPAIPLNPSLLENLLENHIARMPVHFFKMLSAQKLARAFPPPEFEAFKSRLQSIRTPAERFWLKLWEPERQVGFLSLCTIPAKLPRRTAQDGTPLLDLETILLHEHEVINRFLADYVNHIDDWSNYIRWFAPARRNKPETCERWELYCKPLVEYMIARIQTLRSQQCMQQPTSEQPAVLPDEFTLRLWLVTWPILFPCEDDAEIGLRRERFAHDIGALLDELVASGRPYSAQFNDLTTAAYGIPAKARPEIAVRVDRISSSNTTNVGAMEVQRAEIAGGMLKDCQWAELKQDRKELWNDCQGMVERWKWCSDEGLRRMGWTVSKVMKAATPDERNV